MVLGVRSCLCVFGGHDSARDRARCCPVWYPGRLGPVPLGVHQEWCPHVFLSPWSRVWPFMHSLVSRAHPASPRPAASGAGTVSTMLIPDKPLQLQTFALLPLSLAVSRRWCSDEATPALIDPPGRSVSSFSPATKVNTVWPQVRGYLSLRGRPHPLPLPPLSPASPHKPLSGCVSAGQRREEVSLRRPSHLVWARFHEGLPW